MEIYPAIDILGGRAVRLLQGDYAKTTVFDEDPVAVAQHFRALGAAFIHVVDLDGARTGETVNRALIGRLAGLNGLRIEVGGGIRTLEAAEQYLEAGVSRVILGTAAAEDPELTGALSARFGDRIAVGIDIADGHVKVRGWLGASPLTAGEMCRRLLDMGIGQAIVTDISRDGAMKGPNTALYARLCCDYPGLFIVASGGVSGHDDLKALRETGVRAAIVGRACYTGAVDLKRALEENR